MHGSSVASLAGSSGTPRYSLAGLQRRQVHRLHGAKSVCNDRHVNTPSGTMALLQNTLGNDLRLLETAALFDAHDGASGTGATATVGSPKQLLLQVLRCLRGNPDAAQLSKAQKLYKQLAAELSCHPDSAQLEPLRSYLHLKLWGGNSSQRKELQSYLIRELDINFEALAEDEPKPSAAAHTAAGGSSSSAGPPLPTLPTFVPPESYSSSAVAAAHKDQIKHDSWPLARYLAPHQLLPALLDAKAWPVDARWALLAGNQVPVAAVPVEGLVGLLKELIKEMPRGLFGGYSQDAVEVAAALRQAVEAWADGQWANMTAEQVRAVHDLLTQQPLPSGGYASGNRNALAALAFKALSGAPAVSPVTPGVTPQQAEATLKAQQLAALLRLCDELGAQADWIRVHVIRAQLLLAAKQDPAAVPLELLATYLQLLGRCQWSYSSSGPRATPVPATGSTGPWPGARAGASAAAGAGGGGSSSAAHPSHVRCNVCYQQPLVGVRFRSKRQLGVSVCKGCVGKAAARDAAPYEEVAEDDTIYLYPNVGLPSVLGSLPHGYDATWQEVARVLGALAVADGGKRFTPKVNPLVETFGVAVEPRLYWSTVSQAMLTSLTKPQELTPWAEVYQAWGGDIQALRSSSELAFTDGNAVQYGVQEDVVLQLAAKHVGPQGLVVKAYHLNAWGYYTGEDKELGVDLALEGVGPTTEQHIPLPEDSLKRHLLRVPLGLVGQAGVVLVDVVAGARSCRCLIHKGQLVLSSACNAAGQVLTVLYPDRTPAKGARIWCDGKEYAADPSTGAVLLPYVRTTRTASLVLAAPAPVQGSGASAGQISGSADEIVTFIPQYKRLAEFYKLAASISCPHEALLPRTTAQLQVRVGLGLHGEPAPLALLEGAALHLTTTTCDGTEVQQVVEDLDWGADPYQGCVLVPLAVPERVSQVTALLRCRVKLVSPGVNGDPEYQNFEETKRWQVNAMDSQRCVWDLQLTRIPAADSSRGSSASGSTSSKIAGLFKRGSAASDAAAAADSAGGEYALQVVGKAGEVPVVPATIQLDIYHQDWGEGTGIRFKLQSDSQGFVRLGSLSGIRSLKAQFLAPPGTAAAGDVVAEDEGSVLGLQLKQQEALFEDSSTAVRTWQLLGDVNVQPLQSLYNVPQESVLEVPYDTAAISSGQLKPLLLQLAPPNAPTSATTHAGSLEGAQRLVVQGLPVAADVTTCHLRVSSGDISGTLVIGDLPVGYYTLLLPQGPGQVAGSQAGLRKVDIIVMPSAAAATAAAAAEAEGGSRSQVGWEVPGRDGPEVLLVPSSPPKPLSITSASCSPSQGLAVELRGSQAQLESAQVTAVFVRHIPDTTVEAAVRPAAAVQQYGSPEGSEGPAQGWDLPLLPCSGSGSCSYTDSVRVDSAVAYVMQRRQWRAANSLRAGMLLERPSLLVNPRKVRNVAAATTVLRGGDGEQYKPKKMAAAPQQAMCDAYYATACAPACAMPFGASGGPMLMEQQCKEEYGYGACKKMAGGSRAKAAKRRVASAPVSPTLSYLQPAGVLLFHQGVDPATGRLHLPPQQLQQLCGGVDLAAAGYTAVYLQVLDASQGAATLGKCPAAACRVAVQLEPPQEQQQQQQQGAGIRDLGLMRPLTDQGVCAQVLRVVSLPHPGSDLVVSNAGAASLNIYAALPKAVKLMGLLLDRHDVLTPPPVPGVSEAGSAAALWQAQWAGPLSRWPSLGAREQQEAVARLGSCEWSLFLAAKDPAAFSKLVLPLLRFKLPTSLTLLEGLLLLQAAHQQPLLPHPAAATAVGPGAAAYDSAKAAFLVHWGAPHRYAKLNACERVFLAALEGRAACARLAADMRQQLEAEEAAAQGRDIRKGPAPPLTWLHKERRWQFELALACGQSDTDQLQQEEEEGGSDATREGRGSDDADEEDYEMVWGRDEAMEGLAGGGGGPPAPRGMPPPPPAPMAAAAPMMARDRASAAGPPGALGGLARMQVAQAQGVMEARKAVASESSRRAALAPKEVCEWAEAGWWRYTGTSPPVDLIPVSHFWAAYASHLATSTMPAAPFLPEHLTSAAASTAAAVCALAVLGLPFTPGSATAAAAASGGKKAPAAAVQCSYQGASMTLTANSPCLVYLKCIEQVLSAGAAPGAAGSSSSSSGGTGAAVPSTSGSTVSSSVLVVQQLFDPQQPDALDPETGEKVLQQVYPAAQQLLVGRVYGLRCVVTSMSASEQQLELLLQVPQGALPLAGAPAVQPLALTLQPYSSHQQQLYFYFPHAGSFPQVSPSLTKRGKPAWVPPAALPAISVVPHLTPGAQAGGQTTVFDWDAFHRRASNKQLLEWLRDGNLELVCLSDINGRCKDAKFFKQLVDLLTQRKVFDQSILRWSIYHQDEAGLRLYLPGCELLGHLRVPLVTPVTHVVPSDVGQQHLEYWPWVNPYSRPLPGTAQPDIPSVLYDIPAIRQQYQTFLLSLLLSPGQALDATQAAAAATYLLLQDRVDEAEKVLGPHLGPALGAGGSGGQLDTPAAMQVAYLGAWLALCPRLPWGGQQQAAALQTARTALERYGSCSEPVWSKRWAALAAMVNDIANASGAAGSVSQVPAPSSAAAADEVDLVDVSSEPLLTVVGLSGSRLKLKTRALPSIKVAAYEVDAELLFTRQPFGGLLASTSTSSSSGSSTSASSNSSSLRSLAYLRPRACVTLPLGPGQDGSALPAGVHVPADAGSSGGVLDLELDLDQLFPQLTAAALLLELQGGSITRSVPRTSSRLVAHALEAVGQVQVLAPAAGGAGGTAAPQLLPAAGAYVKVFAKDAASGEEWFHKDGYTDLRGRFDYHTLTSAGSGSANKQLRYSLLVLVEGEGSLVLEVAAPARL